MLWCIEWTLQCTKVHFDKVLYNRLLHSLNCRSSKVSKVDIFIFVGRNLSNNLNYHIFSKKSHGYYIFSWPSDKYNLRMYCVFACITCKNSQNWVSWLDQNAYLWMLRSQIAFAMVQVLRIKAQWHIRVQRVEIKVFKMPLFHAISTLICFFWSVDMIYC